MTFRPTNPVDIDITEFHFRLGSYGGTIVPMRDFGLSNIEPDGFGHYEVQFERPLNHRDWLEVISLAIGFGLISTTREQAMLLVQGGKK